MRFLVVMLSGLLFVLPPSALTAAESVTLKDCFLAPDAEVQVPAQEAGVLKKIPVRDGQQVAKDELLAQIDDVVPRKKYEVADYKLKAAIRQASDNIDVRYADMAAKVAAKVHQKNLDANRQTPGTVPEVEVDRQRLDRDRCYLSIEKAQKDLDVAGLQKQVAEAELQQARVEIERRQIVAPVDGAVVKIERHEGEWVNPGDAVIRLVRLDVLRAEGSLNVKNYRPSEIQGRPVEVAVTVVRGPRQSFPGKIVFVNPVIRSDGAFQVRAEVQNRRQDEFWVLSPGMSAEMTIQLK